MLCVLIHVVSLLLCCVFRFSPLISKLWIPGSAILCIILYFFPPWVPAIKLSLSSFSFFQVLHLDPNPACHGTPIRKIPKAESHNYFLLILVCHWMYSWRPWLHTWLSLWSCPRQRNSLLNSYLHSIASVKGLTPTSSDYSSHSIVVKRWGILARKTEKHLIKQFCHGCWNKTVITNLKLEGKKDNPPSFTELLGMTTSRSDSLAMTAGNWHGWSLEKSTRCELTIKPPGKAKKDGCSTVTDFSDYK